MAEPAVSVVVATHNRPRRLGRLLAALRAQTLPRHDFEVIVVDDGSTPATQAVLEEELARGELRLRLERNALAQGQANARNLGWRLAQAPLIAFTDDDCRPTERWLAAALELHCRNRDQIIQGRTESDPEELADLSPLAHTVRRSQLGPSY